MPELVLLPGMDGTGNLFGPFLAALDAALTVRVIAYPRDRTMSYAELADWVSDRLPTEDFTLLGESFSGPVAAMVAARQPPNLRALVLCATFVRNPRPGVSLASPLTRFLPMSRTWARLSSPLLIGTGAPVALRDTYVESVGGLPSRVLQARLREVLSVDVSDRLARVSVPVLYLRATRDRLVPPAAGKWISILRPDVQTIDIDAPHGMLQAAPLACAEAVGTFVRGLA